MAALGQKDRAAASGKDTPLKMRRLPFWVRTDAQAERWANFLGKQKAQKEYETFNDKRFCRLCGAALSRASLLYITRVPKTDVAMPALVRLYATSMATEKYMSLLLQAAMFGCSEYTQQQIFLENRKAVDALHVLTHGYCSPSCMELRRRKHGAPSQQI